MHGFAAEMGGAIPSSTVTGRGPAVLHGIVGQSEAGGHSTPAAECERWTASHQPSRTVASKVLY
jgi:hypothetical protein